MKNVFICFVAIATLSCNAIWKKTVNGNGNIITQERNLSTASKIESSGDF